MKIRILLLLFWSSVAVFAQTKPDSTASFKEKADYVLTLLPKAGVSSGILLDRVFPFSGISDWSKDSIGHDTASGKKMMQALYEIEEARLIPDPSGPFKNLSAASKQKFGSGILAFGILRMEVQMLDTNHFIDSSFSISSSDKLIYQGNGSPYASRQLKMASFLNAKPLQAGQIYQLEYPQVFTNVDRANLLAYVRFRLQGSSWQTILPGQTLPVSFAAAGNYIYDFEIGWQDGTTLSNPGQLTVTQVCVNSDDPNQPDDCPWWKANYAANCGNEGIAIEANIAFQNVKGRGEVYYYRKGGVGTSCDFNAVPFTKPVIFVDGIDFEDGRKGQAIYGKYLRYNQTLSGGTPVTKFIGEELRIGNHDLLILNFPDGNKADDVAAGKAHPGLDGGCDYIERNAMTLVKLIQQVRDNLAAHGNSADKITIIGPSMGGLIARYALAYMEKNQSITGPHSCKLFVSQDAPHLGANIPYGLQALVKDLSETYGNKDAGEYFKEKISSPASKELMLNFISSIWSGPDPLRTAFLQNQILNSPANSQGWPTDPGLRKIALVNGSMASQPALADVTPSGTPIYVVAEDSFLEMNVKLSKTAGALLAIFRSIPLSFGLRSFSVDFSCRYGPSGGATSRQVYKNTIQANYFFGNKVLKTVKTINTNAFNSGVSLDAAPGGIYDGPLKVVQEVDDWEGNGNFDLGFDMDAFADATITKFRRFNSFIPTKSALAFRWKTEPNLTSNLGENLTNRNMYCTDEIPFDAYYGENFNSEHISLTSKKADWLMQEINATQPPVPQPTLSISGSNVVTFASGREFTAVAGPCPFPILYYWQIVEKSGIEASVSDITLQTCSIMTSDANGSKNGHFVLRLVASINDPTTGETRCIGERTLKIYVKNCGLTPFVPTCFFIRQNYSLKMCVGTPSVPPGVSFINHEFEVSRYPNSDFGNAIVSGGVTEFELITPNTNCPKLYCKINFAPAGQYLVYIRRRAKYQVVLPGETNPTIFYTNWSAGHPLNLVYRTSGTMCPGMIMMVVSPNPAIKGTDNAITVNTSNNQITLPTLAYIKDARGMVVDRFQVMALPFTRSISKLAPAEYTLFLDPAGENETKNFVVASSIDDKVIVSPNPVFKEVDENVTVKILSDSLGGDSAFVVLGENAQGLRQIEQEGEGKSFEVDVTGLQVGDYNVHVLGQANQFEGNSQLEVIGNLDLNLTPNPVTTNLSIELLNPVNPPASYHIKVTDKFGLVVKELDMTANPMVLPVDNLMPDIYYINISDGSQVMSKIFRKD
jgi:hypothetical protein